MAEQKSAADAICYVVRELEKLLPKFLDENRRVLRTAGMNGAELKRMMALLELGSYEAALLPALRCMRELIEGDSAAAVPPLRDVIDQVRDGITRH